MGFILFLFGFFMVYWLIGKCENDDGDIQGYL